MIFIFISVIIKLELIYTFILLYIIYIIKI
nr:MAG TPA: hypothetical protein [Caudoviricetes sp.]